MEGSDKVTDGFNLGLKVPGVSDEGSANCPINWESITATAEEDGVVLQSLVEEANMILCLRMQAGG